MKIPDYANVLLARFVLAMKAAHGVERVKAHFISDGNRDSMKMLFVHQSQNI